MNLEAAMHFGMDDDPAFELALEQGANQEPS